MVPRGNKFCLKSTREKISVSLYWKPQSNEIIKLRFDLLWVPNHRRQRHFQFIPILWISISWCFSFRSTLIGWFNWPIYVTWCPVNLLDMLDINLNVHLPHEYLPEAQQSWTNCSVDFYSSMFLKLEIKLHDFQFELVRNRIGWMDTLI